MIRPRDIKAVEQCKEMLNKALGQLRALAGGSNLVAQASIEYRIARLRQRREELR